MSLVTMSENLLMPHAADSLDLSPRGEQRRFENADHSSRLSPATAEYPGRAPSPTSGPPPTAVLAYREQPRSPAVYEDLETTSNPDLVWQQQRGADRVGVPRRTSQGLAGLSGGSLLALTNRASHLTVRSGAQWGGYGRTGDSGRYACGEKYGPWSDPRMYSDCLDMSASSPAECGALCGGFTAPTDGGAGGAGGEPGTLHVVGAADPAPWCAFSESGLRGGPGAGIARGDAPERLDIRCANGQPDDRSGADVDCASPFCGANLDVNVCGTREAVVIDLEGGPIVVNPRLPFLISPKGSVPKGSVPKPLPTVGIPKAPRPPIEIEIDSDALCGDSLSDAFTLNTADGGGGGFSGGVATSLCTKPGYPLPMLCGASARSARGAAGPPGGGTPVMWYRDVRSAWTRLAWAIAMHRLMPLEIPRRLAVAHQRFRSGALDAARGRYLSTQFLIAANQRRSVPGQETGKVFDCARTIGIPDTPTKVGRPPEAGLPAPEGLSEICGLRTELDTYLARLTTGRNFYGYSADYTVPRVVPTTELIKWAQTEIAQAQASLAEWQLASAIDDVAKTVSERANEFLDDQLDEVRQRVAPTGSLTTALENTHRAQRESIAAMAALDHMAHADTAYLVILKNDDATEASFSFDKLEMSVIGAGIKAAVSAAGLPEAAGPVSDAITGAIGPDKVGYDGSESARLNVLAREMTDGLPYSSGAALDAESTPEGSRDLQRLKLHGELFQILLRMRDEVRTYARALAEEHLVLAQIAEARAREQRLVGHASDHARHDPAALDALLAGSYVAALRGVRRAGEYTFLAVRAAERDGIPFSVAPDGTVTNQLFLALDGVLAGCTAPSAKSSRFIDLRLDPVNLDCHRTMLKALDISVLGFTSMYKQRGSVTKVVPLLPSMRFADPTTGAARYRVSVDVALADAPLPPVGSAAAHKLSDLTVLLDTGLGATETSMRVSFARTGKDAFWLGPTSAGGGTGKSPDEFTVLGGAGGGPFGAESAAPLQILALMPGWTAEPTLTFPLCRGSAANNAALVTSPSGPPAACRLSTVVPTAAAAYLGRALLGRYNFTLPADALVGTTNALRVFLQFEARSPL